MSKYRFYNSVGKYKFRGRYELIASGMVKAFWISNDYKKLLDLVCGSPYLFTDTHFCALAIAEHYNLDFTTPYEVSMWLKKQIREEKNGES